jgi:hypothetical protein
VTPAAQRPCLDAVISSSHDLVAPPMTKLGDKTNAAAGAAVFFSLCSHIHFLFCGRLAAHDIASCKGVIDRSPKSDSSADRVTLIKGCCRTGFFRNRPLREFHAVCVEDLPHLTHPVVKGSRIRRLKKYNLL